MSSIAVTDHGLDLGGMATPSTFLEYERTPAKMEGVRVFRGIEANLRIDGTTDVQEKYEKQLDIILLGIHATRDNNPKFQYLSPEDRTLLLPTGESETYYTALLHRAIAQNSIDVITHPPLAKFPINMDAIVEACKEKGVAIELNNSIYANKRKNDPKKHREMIDAINKYVPRIVISSDAHCYMEIGELGAVKRILKEYPIEADVELVNRTLKSTEAFVKERKELRQAA